MHARDTWELWEQHKQCKRVWNYGEQKRGQWKEHYWEHVKNTIKNIYSSYPPP
jgi:hypothetical protein